MWPALLSLAAEAQGNRIIRFGPHLLDRAPTLRRNNKGLEGGESWIMRLPCAETCETVLSREPGVHSSLAVDRETAGDVVA